MAKYNQWNIGQLPEIEYPKNSQRSVSAWQRIGYKPRPDETPIGAVKGEYKRYFAVWDDTQVTIIPGAAARVRRDQYHAYLFRLRVWGRFREKICSLHQDDPDQALMFVSELMEDLSLWQLGVLVVTPAKQYQFDKLVVTDALKTVKPIAPALLKAEQD